MVGGRSGIDRDPWTGDYVWSQDGERIVQPDRQVLIDPSVQVAKRDGACRRVLPLPAVERMSVVNQGAAAEPGAHLRGGGATNVARHESLADEDVRPVRKELVADLSDFGLSTVDNIEGMTWGPTLRSGERTLLLVSDDNFAVSQVNQVVALAIR